MRLVLFCLLACFLSYCVSAADFDQCLSEIRDGKHGTIGGTDNQGNPVRNIADATAITIELCNRACGSGQKPFDWTTFSTQFSAWFLPFIALLSQLPFGSPFRLDNLMSVVLTIGSPTLAAYSLALTVLNGNWVSKRFARHKYPNARMAARLVTGLQHTPLKVTRANGLLSSLVVLPQNDRWWKEALEGLEYHHDWSISAAASLAWVLLAYIFTVVDAFSSIESLVILDSQGLSSVGSVWLWLLPVVVGWLQLSPKSDSIRLRKALDHANNIAHSSTAGGIITANSLSENHAISIHNHKDDAVLRDVECTPPVFNYARLFSWARQVEKIALAFDTASINAKRNVPVDPNITWIMSSETLQISPGNRMGEADQVNTYCRSPPEVVLRHWTRGVLSRCFIASLLALCLQWGTTGAAIIIVWFTPTTGLGCRSAAYIIYGSISTIAWAILVTSSILAHYSVAPIRDGSVPAMSVNSTMKSWSSKGDSRARSGLRPKISNIANSRHAARLLSILLRRFGKVVASCNAVWILTSSLFQYTNFYKRCYCDASVMGRGMSAYDVIELVESDISPMKTAWVGGIILALGVDVLFLGFINVFLDTPLPEL